MGRNPICSIPGPGRKCPSFRQRLMRYMHRPAWELAMDLRPSVDLFTSDGSHPNELGCLLTASVFVRAICGELPEIVPSLYRIEDAQGETVRLMNHNPEESEFCRRIANEIVELQ